MSLECGQVLWLKIRFNNSGDVSATTHPYLVLSKDEELGTVEVGQIDSLAGKEYKAAFICNKVIDSLNPTETVIYKDSFLQMDNKFMIEDYAGLEMYRKTEDKLSEAKYNDACTAYQDYQEKHHISENKIVYLTQDEIENLNK